MMNSLHFLFLQGEPTSFYKRVGHGLSMLGCKVSRINFCAGDQLFWSGKNTLNFRGRISEWPDYFSGVLSADKVTDIVLCGEQRSYHKVAIEIAQSRGIRVVVTDLGYLRPDWITLELDGMNGNSRFPKNAQEISALAADSPGVDLAKRYENDTIKIEAAFLVFELANYFLFFLFPHYRRTDNRRNLLLHYLFGIRKLLLSSWSHRRSSGQLKRLRDSGEPYFVFPLQLEHDYAILSYSPFSNLEEPIRIVMQSFANNASANCRLAFKSHPMDTGVKNWRSLVFRWAREEGVADRIVYFDGGNLDEMFEGAQGVITVNSTAGIRALQLGCPVMALGDAIYDISGMTDQGSLDLYWKEPRKPSPELVDAFVKAITRTILVRGVFLNEPGLGVAVKGTVARLSSCSVGMPS